MNYSSMMTLTIGLLLLAAPVLADEVIIKYRSGKVQTIQVNDTTDPVEQVSYRKSEKATPDAASESQNTPLLSPSSETKRSQPEQEKASTQKTSESVKNLNKPTVKFKWAQPIEAQ
jgi:hypothetical protein